MKNEHYRQKMRERERADKAVPRNETAKAAPVPEGSDEEMVEHIRKFTSLIEGREVSRIEILEMLAAEEKREHSMGGVKKTGYGARDLNGNSS